MLLVYQIFYLLQDGCIHTNMFVWTHVHIHITKQTNIHTYMHLVALVPTAGQRDHTKAMLLLSGALAAGMTVILDCSSLFLQRAWRAVLALGEVDHQSKGLSQNFWDPWYTEVDERLLG